MNLAEQISYEKIRLFELQLTNPNLGVTMAHKIEQAMLYETSWFLKDKRHKEFEPEKGSKIYENNEAATKYNSPMVWDTKQGKYLRK